MNFGYCCEVVVAYDAAKAAKVDADAEYEAARVKYEATRAEYEKKGLAEAGDAGVIFRKNVREILGNCVGPLPRGETWAAMDEGVLQYLRDIVDKINAES